MPRYTLGQAAKATGKSKTQIARAVESGKISAERDGPTGPYSIDAAELHRVYPMVTDTGDSDADAERSETPPVTPETASDTGGLAVEVAVLREKLRLLETYSEREREQLNRQIEDLRQDREKWREQAERATRLLPPPTMAPPAPVASPDRPKGWRRWFRS